MGFDIDLHDPDEVFKPGTTALVCWNYKDNSEHREHDDDPYDDTDYDDADYHYWIGVICGVGTMPAELWQKRPPGTVVPRENWKVEPKMTTEKQYPVFLPTKGVFYWLPRRVIGYLGKPKRNKFERRRFDFKMLYEMALDTKRYSREYWLGLARDVINDAIREDNLRKAHRIEARLTKKSKPQVSTQDQASGEGEQQNASQVKESENEQPSRKRARTRDSSSSHLTRSTSVPGRQSSTVAMTETNDDNGVEIKQEGVEGSRHQVITVYIGMQNRVFKISQDDLLQSPVLSGYIRGTSFIMEPDLMEIDNVLFEAVDEFLTAGEFQPCYILKEGKADFQPGAGSLYGIDGYNAYSTQLLRLGKLYILAWEFKIARMMLLIRRKVIAGFPEGCRNNQTMLDFIDQIFQDMPGLVENAAADQSEGAKTNDPLKEWLVTWLAENMRECNQSLLTGVPKQYWDTLDKGVGLSLAVHRAKVQMIEKHKGELVKTEDDEVGGHERVDDNLVSGKADRRVTLKLRLGQ